MHLNHRIERLEQRVPPLCPAHCGACGLRLPGVPHSGPVQFEVGGYAPGDPEEPPCPECGQKSVIRIEFDRAG